MSLTVVTVLSSRSPLEAPVWRVTPWWGPPQGPCGTQLLIGKYASGMDCVSHARWLRGEEMNRTWLLLWRWGITGQSDSCSKGVHPMWRKGRVKSGDQGIPGIGGAMFKSTEVCKNHKNMTCLFMILKFYLCPCLVLASENCLREWQEGKLRGWAMARFKGTKQIYLPTSLNQTAHVKCFQQYLPYIPRGLFLLFWDLWETSQVLRKGNDKIRFDNIRDLDCL